MTWYWWVALAAAYIVVGVIVAGVAWGSIDLKHQRRLFSDSQGEPDGSLFAFAAFWPIGVPIALLFPLFHWVAWLAAGGAAGDTARRLQQKK